MNVVMLINYYVQSVREREIKLNALGIKLFFFHRKLIQQISRIGMKGTVFFVVSSHLVKLEKKYQLRFVKNDFNSCNTGIVPKANYNSEYKIEH